MNDNTPSINDFDFSLICEYFASIERQGPGSEEATLRALSLIPDLNSMQHIADLGCGTGSSAFTLAQHTQAHITALDLFPLFVEKLTAKADALGLSHRLSAVVGDMGQLPFQEEQFNAIWSEGAIYNIGFRRGMQEWHRYIKQGGYIAVTDATWLTEQRPKEIADFWNDAYPEIDTLANNLQTMMHYGYKPVATFVLDDSCWTHNFYHPQRQAQIDFLSKHPNDKTAEMLIANQRHEAAMYEQYSAYYGYVFYIGQKIDMPKN